MGNRWRKTVRLGKQSNQNTGFYTNFKDTDYSYNKDQARMSVEAEAMSLGLCYKLVDIEWCAQLHPDP